MNALIGPLKFPFTVCMNKSDPTTAFSSIKKILRRQVIILFFFIKQFMQNL